MRRLLAASAGLCAVGCAVLLLDAGRLPSGLVALREIPVLPSGVSPRRHPAALYIQQTLSGLKSDADEKLAGRNLHRHTRRKGAAGSQSRGQLARAEARKAARVNVLDPDVEEARERKFESFERGQTLADLQRSLSSPLFSAQGRARAVLPADQARIAKLESAKLPGPLDAIPKDMLNAEKAQTTMLTDRLSFRGVNTGYPEDRVEYVPHVGGKLMHAFGVNTGEEGAWEGEDHWDDEQVPIGESFSTHYGLQPAQGHPEGFGVNKYWAPVFGARGESVARQSQAKLKAQETTMLTDRLSFRGVNTGYPEDRVEYVPHVGGKLMHAFGVNTGEEGAWEGEDHWDDEQVPIGESFSTHYGLQPAQGHPEGFGVNKYWAPVFGARGETGTPRRETMLAQVEAEVEDNNGIPELRLDEDPKESASRSSLRSIPGPSSSGAGSSRRDRAQGREEEREDEERARTVREKPSKTAQRREEERDVAEQAQAREQQKQYTPEAAAEAAAWIAAGSQGPVNAGGGVLDAKMAARSMEDGAVADSEESDAMNTLRAAMVDARQKTPGHREPVARRPRLSTR
jgi:hypothetical protein